MTTRCYPQFFMLSKKQSHIHVTTLQPTGNPFIKTYSGVNTDVNLFSFKIPGGLSLSPFPSLGCPVFFSL